jgi:hypothetical protein
LKVIALKARTAPPKIAAAGKAPIAKTGAAAVIPKTPKIPEAQ